MFDLNFSADHSFSGDDSDQRHASLLAATQPEDSGTAASSVVNGDCSGELSSYGCLLSNAAESELTRKGTELVTQQFLRMREVTTTSFGEGKRAVLQVRKRSRRGPKSRSSEYRGVTFYRRTGRWESHIWLYDVVGPKYMCKEHSISTIVDEFLCVADAGRQVYLGGFDTDLAAARAYDRAALKFRGADADINFALSDYEDQWNRMNDFTKEEYVLVLRRQSTGQCRGSSRHRSLALPKCGILGAQTGHFFGKKTYDKAAIECNREEEETNFEANTYVGGASLVNNNQDKHHNLDLNLWISPPSGDQKENDSFRRLHLHDAVYGLPSVKRTKFPKFTSTPTCREVLNTITMPSNQLPKCPGMYSGLRPNLEETVFRKMEPAAEAAPWQGFSNWAWQMNSHGMVSPLPLFSNAASSGFSSSTAPLFIPPYQ